MYELLPVFFKTQSLMLRPIDFFDGDYSLDVSLIVYTMQTTDIVNIDLTSCEPQATVSLLFDLMPFVAAPGLSKP